MKKRVENPAEPIRFYTKRPDGTLVEQDVWVCGECKILTVGNHTHEGARNCCRIQRCEKHGEEIKPYYSGCQKCQDEAWDAKRQTAWQAMPVVEYAGEPICHNNRFYESMDDFVEHLDDLDDDEDRPDHVELCSVSPVGSRVDPGSIIDTIVENMTEDFEDPDQVTIVGEKALRTALEKFAKANTYTVWTPNGTRAVVPPKEEHGRDGKF